MAKIVDIKNLSVTFQTSQGPLKAVENIDLSIEEGEAMGIVGESGSGKSVSMMALMGLIRYPGIVEADKLEFQGRDLLQMSDKEKRLIIGRDLSMIFQEPMTSLNPSYTIGFQIMEVFRAHKMNMTRRQQKERAIELLDLVGIPSPEKRLKSFPHQLSGGMNQRVMIAMAIACEPNLLIADEPTTALDVTIQAQILDLLVRLQKEKNMTLILITHDMGVVAETTQRVTVMYSGQIVETRCVESLFSAPHHPYTHCLLEALPERSHDSDRLETIMGTVPAIHDRPKGCLFSPRCPYVQDKCHNEAPAFFEDTEARCFFPLNLDKEGSK